MHFGAIHSPKFANMLQFYRRHKTYVQYFMTFFRNADSVHGVSSSGAFGQHQATKQGPTLVAFLKPIGQPFVKRFALRYLTVACPLSL